MEKRIHISAISYIGNSRDNQEDNYLVHRGGFLPSDVRDDMPNNRTPYHVKGDIDPHRFLAAVSDGMGGHASGEVASLMTVDYLSVHYDTVIDSIKSGERALAAHIAQINKIISTMSKNNPNFRGMGATLCGVLANGSDLVGFNVGDSRLYQFKDGRLTQLSTDHTEGQRLINLQLLTEAEVKNFSRRKMLHKYIGYGADIVPDVFKITGADKGSLLMLCTDGLSDVLTNDEIEQLLIGPNCLEEKATQLVHEAASRNIGCGDNITVILIEF